MKMSNTTMTRSKYDTKLLRPEEVKTLFNIHKPQPFLSRQLDRYEIALVTEWEHYYRSRLMRNPCFPRECFRDFLDKMRPRFHGGKVLEGPANDPNVVFHDLFVYSPSITISGAMARFIGTQIHPTEIERKLMFRETVFMHQEMKNGELPHWHHFRTYNNRRVFLTNVGLLVPSIFSLRYGNAGPVDSLLSSAYRAYFEVPGELDEKDVIELDNPKPTIEDLIDNYRDVCNWQRQLFPEFDLISPTEGDVNFYADMFGGYRWNDYKNWIYMRREYVVEQNGVERSIEWIRSKAGAPRKSLSISGKYKRNRNYWTEKRIREHYIELWRSENPDSFIENVKLYDPPTPEKLLQIGKMQLLIKHASGGNLDAERCVKIGVSPLEVPPFSTINKNYPGGMLKLLYDIEKEFAPVAGIIFNDSKRVASFAAVLERSDIDILEMPKTVRKYIEKNVEKPVVHILGPTFGRVGAY